MIRVLRRRLTLLVIGVLVLVSVGIVLSIHGINRRNIDIAAVAALQTLSENGGQRPGAEPDGVMPRPFGDGGTPQPGETPPEKPPVGGMWSGAEPGQGSGGDGQASGGDGVASGGQEMDRVSGETLSEKPPEGGPWSGVEPGQGSDGQASGGDGVASGGLETDRASGETPPEKPPEAGIAPVEPPSGERPWDWRGFGAASMASLSNAYTITLDADGAVTEWSSDRSDLYTDDQIQAVADAVVSDGRQTGRVDAQYYSVIAGEDGGTRLIVLDARLEFLSARRVLRTTALVASAACLLLSVGAALLIRRMLQPVQASFDRQKQFVWDASHEIKTPLAVISANAEVLAREIGSNEYLGYIQSEVRRTDGLVQNLLTLARMDKGTVTANLKRMNLSDALLSVALPFESTVFEAGRTLETDVPEGVFCRGDEAMLQQLVVILLSNALKYSDEGGLIRLSLAQRGRGCAITVYNTGRGIAPEHLEKVFDRFYREDASHNSEVAGNGLGLAIARTIVEAHKGRIHAESDYGKSATFIVTLPG